MKRQFAPKVLTANHLLSGDVIYRGHRGEWVSRHRDAVLFNDEHSADSALAAALEQSAIAVGPYLANAQMGENGPEPVHFREAFRTRGPSNYPHGKQVDHV